MKLIFLLTLINLLGFGQIKYTNIVDQGIYKSYIDTINKTTIAVTYTLYKGGGEASRAKDYFKYDVQYKTQNASDYYRSGYDKGHMANAEDFAFSDSLEELTFRYYNCVPQTPELNRGIWKHYETQTRTLSQSDTIIVVCYNEFLGKLQGRLQIPFTCYKAVYNFSDKKLLFVIGLTNSAQPKEVMISPEVLENIKKLIP